MFDLSQQLSFMRHHQIVVDLTNLRCNTLLPMSSQINLFDVSLGFFHIIVQIILLVYCMRYLSGRSCCHYIIIEIPFSIIIHYTKENGNNTSLKIKMKLKLNLSLDVEATSNHRD